jgi:predicted membrane channel-forming protein YqfA (hemolysin III family)
MVCENVLLPLSASGVARLRRVDHMMIFVLIAGTYTPFCLLALDGVWRVGLLVLVWGLALCGILLKFLWMGAPRWLSVALYLGMGWVAVIAAPALLRAVPPGGMAWVLGGGLVYSVGAIVYGLRRPNPWPGGSDSTSCGTSSSWQEAPAISGRCCRMSRRLPKGSGVMPGTLNMYAGLAGWGC